MSARRFPAAEVARATTCRPRGDHRSRRARGLLESRWAGTIPILPPHGPNAKSITRAIVRQRSLHAGSWWWMGGSISLAMTRTRLSAKSEEPRASRRRMSPSLRKTLAHQARRAFPSRWQRLPQAQPGDVAEVWLAVTEDGLHSPVSRGRECRAGSATHCHAAVLAQDWSREPQLRHLVRDNSSSVKFDSGWNLDNLRVTVFVQEKKSREIRRRRFH